MIRFSVLEIDNEVAKRKISKLQRDRDTWVISEDEFEQSYETVMQDLRLRFAQIMDGASWEAYKLYRNEPSPPITPWV